MIVCPNCQAENLLESKLCYACQYDLVNHFRKEAEGQQKDRDKKLSEIVSANSGRSYFSTLLLMVALTICLFPWNIPAMIFAAIANHQSENGNAKEAFTAHKKSLKWMWTALGFAVIVLMIALATKKPELIHFMRPGTPDNFRSN